MLPVIDIPATITAIGAVVAAVGVILTAWWAYRAKTQASEATAQITVVGKDVYELGKRVDGRLTELLDAAAAKGVTDAALARAEGQAEGEQKQRDRQAPPENGK